jgi:hypothetical protein
VGVPVPSPDVGARVGDVLVIHVCDSGVLAVPRADVREGDHIAQLFGEISTCEETLKIMQDMLVGFRSNLGGISEEIKHLQNESLTMNVKLGNRRAVHARVATFLDKVAVTEEMINVITEVCPRARLRACYACSLVVVPVPSWCSSSSSSSSVLLFSS